MEKYLSKQTVPILGVCSRNFANGMVERDTVVTVVRRSGAGRCGGGS